MKNKTSVLKIYNFSHPLISTELLSISGDKYVHTLPFQWEVVRNYDSSDVVLWDGIITPKNQNAVSKILTDVTGPKILLLIGESMTLLKDHPIVKIINPEGLNFVEVSGWSALPEEILQALEICHKKLKHV